MCGIAGILNLDGQSFRGEALLKSMADSMTHRGPDAHGYFVSGPVGLAHRRLSIIDLSSGDQPMFNEDHSLVVVFNGEIYNHQELRSILESKGHHYRTRSDTEAILHSYEEFGRDFHRYLTGMFAFALWDSRRRRLVLSRDRLGIKPLYYTVHNGQLIFASEIKAILTIKEIPRRVDLQALQAYLRLRYVPGPKTMFEGIFKLQPGHSMTIENGHVRIEEYWDLAFSEEPLDEKQGFEDLEKLLFEVCRQHLMSEVPFGVFLSGGLDSSSVAALLRSILKNDLMTFTVGYEHAEATNEFEFGRIVSQHAGTSHHEIVLSPKEFSDWIPRLTWHLDEPVGDSSCIPLFFLARHAKERATVLHSGEGADEIFAGYSIYKKMALISRIQAGFLGPAARFIGSALGPLAQGGKLGRYLRFLSQPLDTRYRGVSGIFQDGAKDGVIKRELWNQSGEASFLEETFAAYYGRVESASELNRMLYVDTKAWLPDDLLVKADKMTMAASVELRVPFLDHRLVEFAARLPADWKIRNGVTKYALKKMMERYLPTSVIYRTKKGFPTPIRDWFRTDLHDLSRELLLDPCSAVSRYTNATPLKGMLAAHQHGKLDASDELWSLLVLEYWFRTFEVSA